MAEPTELEEQIAAARALLASGATEVEVDGQQIKVDLQQVERNLEKLLVQAGLKRRRPRVARIRLVR